MKPTSTIEEQPADQKHGQWLRATIEARKAVLELKLAELQNSEQQGGTVAVAIETALATLDELLPGDLDHISPVVASSLAHWLESHRYLGDTEASRLTTPH